GKGLLRLVGLEGDGLDEALRSLAGFVAAGRLGKLGIERIDGEPVIGSALEPALVAAGFSRQPRRLVTPA
nr:hypothetical protein [Solirubrobacterales bacterium]